jgi:predicted ATPase with chaperone activity
VARALADLDASAGVRRVQVAEALSYRWIAPARS